jgi:glutathione S-transferase
VVQTGRDGVHVGRGGNREGRIRVAKWSFFQQYSLELNIATPRFWITHHVEFTWERRLSLETKRNLGNAALNVMEDHLTAKNYSVADPYTVADVSLYSYTHVAGEGGYDLERFPAVRAWLESLPAQPGYVPIKRG